MADYIYGSGVPYGQYLQENAYVRDVTGQIKKSGEATQQKISSQTIKIVASNERLSQKFGAGFDAVNGTLDVGFSRVESALGDVETSIESLHSDFNYNMGLILDQLQIQNQLTYGILERLDAIHKTLENPELTKAREFYNRGCERLSKGLLNEALEALSKSIEINDTDFFTQFHIGKLYLYGVNEEDNVINIEKAEQHLTLAARYGKAEITELQEFRKWTGEALLHASIACYAQANDQNINGNSTVAKDLLSKAYQYVHQACEIYPSLSESQYHLAKYAALLGDTQTSLQSLENAIYADVNYCIKVDFDQDFNNIRPQVFDLFEQLRIKMNEITQNRLEESSQKYLKEVVYLTTEGKKSEEEIRNLTSDAKIKINKDNTLFDIHDAQDIINQIEQIFLSIPVIIEKYSIDYVPSQYSSGYKISPNCKYIATYYGGNVKLYKVSDGELLTILNGDYAHFSPDDNLLIIGTKSNIKLWLISDGKFLFEINSYASQVGFSPDSKLLAFSNAKGTNLWLIRGNKLISTLPGDKESFYFSPDGRFLLTQKYKKFKLFKVSSGKLIRKFFDDNIHYINLFNPDGNILVAYTKNDSTKLLHTNDGKLIHTLTGKPKTFSPDGKFLATLIIHESCIKIWLISDGSLVQTIPGIRGADDVEVSFSPDNKLITITDIDVTNSWVISDGKPKTIPNGLNKIWPEGRQINLPSSISFDGKLIIDRNEQTIKFYEQSIIPRQEFQKYEDIKKEISYTDPEAKVSKQKLQEDQLSNQIYEKEKKQPRNDGFCMVCGAKLSFIDKLRGKTNCSKHS